MSNLRTCVDCGEKKELAEFPKSTAHREGHSYYCKECKRFKNRKYYDGNRDKVLAKTVAYMKANMDKHRGYQKAAAPRIRFQQIARWNVTNAVRVGKFEKTPCVDCGKTEMLVFHHTNGYDQDNWFTGEWVCRPHHGIRHRKPRTRDQFQENIKRYKDG